MQPQETNKTEVTQHLVEWAATKFSSHHIRVFSLGISLNANG